MDFLTPPQLRTSGKAGRRKRSHLEHKSRRLLFSPFPPPVSRGRQGGLVGPPRYSSPPHLSFRADPVHGGRMPPILIVFFKCMFIVLFTIMGKNQQLTLKHDNFSSRRRICILLARRAATFESCPPPRGERENFSEDPEWSGLPHSYRRSLHPHVKRMLLRMKARLATPRSSFG